MSVWYGKGSRNGTCDLFGSEGEIRCNPVNQGFQNRHGRLTILYLAETLTKNLTFAASSSQVHKYRMAAFAPLEWETNIVTT